MHPGDVAHAKGLPDSFGSGFQIRSLLAGIDDATMLRPLPG